MRRDRKKDLCRRERDFLEGPHEEAEIQRKLLRRRKNLAFSEDACLEKEKVRSKVTPRKVGVELKRRRLAWWGSTEKKEASHLLGLREHQRSNRNRAPAVASTAEETEGEEDQMARSSA